jgi:hypothetical protein
MADGRGRACLEAALRAATAGTLDKGAEAREAGAALVLTLVQVSSPPLCLPYHTALPGSAFCQNPSSMQHFQQSEVLRLHAQVYGKAEVAHAVGGLSGGAKRAATEALAKAASNPAASSAKAAVPALELPGVRSFAISVSCDSSPRDAAIPALKQVLLFSTGSSLVQCSAGSNKRPALNGATEPVEGGLYCTHLHYLLRW